MNKPSADEILINMIDLFLEYLDSLSGECHPNQDQFVSGERTAYVECLEIIQCWEHAHKNGLDFDIEAKFSI